jgi:hypothetical protein
LGVSPSALQAPVRSLLDAGVLQRVDEGPAGRERMLRPDASSMMWALAAQLVRREPPNQLHLEFN